MNKRELVAWGIAGLSCACAIGTYISHRRTASLLKKTVKELAESSPVEIEKDVVDAVVQEALEMKVDNQVDEILEETKKDLNREIESRVRKAVAAELVTVSGKVQDEFYEEINDLTAEDCKDVVIERASELVTKKLDGQLDQIYRDYQKRLDQFNSLLTRSLNNAPQVALASSVNPGLHLQW